MGEIGGEGSRIRTLRQQMGVAQAAFARASGISASYLNLIERGRRLIGGKVLSDLARALETDPAILLHSVAATLIEGLCRSATAGGAENATAPEIDRAEALTSAFPDWVSLVARQHDRIGVLERSVASLGERLSQILSCPPRCTRFCRP